MRLISCAVLHFLLAGVVFSSPLQASEIKLVLKAKMVSVEAFNTDEIVDALDPVSAEGVLPGATVVFRIESVVKGTLPPPKPRKSGSVWSQTQEAYKEKNFLKMITMDYDNPDVEREDKPRWFAVGIQSPLETFQVVSWSELPQQTYRLSFSKDTSVGGWVLQSVHTD